MSKHTKGPWSFKYDDETRSGVNVYGNNGQTQIIDFVMGENLDEAEANARLIAASPDLLKALEAIADISPCTYEDAVEAVNIAKAAIQKATQP